MGAGIREVRSPLLINSDDKRMNYKKDYSGKSAERWFAERSWTGFLMTVPIDTEVRYVCGSVGDIMSIRSTASQLSNDPDCDRKFSVYTDLDSKFIRVTATLKDNGKENSDASAY